MALSHEHPNFSKQLAELFDAEFSSQKEMIAHCILLVLLALLLVTAAEKNKATAQNTQDFTALDVQALPDVFVTIRGKNYAVEIDHFEVCGLNGELCAFVKVIGIDDDESYYDLVPISQLLYQGSK